jgi:hypothetical protein
MSRRNKQRANEQDEIGIYDYPEFSNILFEENKKDNERFRQNRLRDRSNYSLSTQTQLMNEPPLSSISKIRQEENEQQNNRIEYIERPNQQYQEGLEQELSTLRKQLKHCHELLLHEQRERNLLHRQDELREKEDELRQEGELRQNELSFGQDQLNQHEELERERRNKSEGGTRKKSRKSIRVKKLRKSRRVRKSRSRK